MEVDKEASPGRERELVISRKLGVLALRALGVLLGVVAREERRDADINTEPTLASSSNRLLCALLVELRRALLGVGVGVGTGVVAWLATRLRVLRGVDGENISRSLTVPSEAATDWPRDDTEETDRAEEERLRLLFSPASLLYSLATSKLKVKPEIKEMRQRTSSQKKIPKNKSNQKCQLHVLRSQQ